MPGHADLRALAWLTAADALFLWMFLSADPLEQMAVSGALRGQGAILPDEAFEFAANWRHGMAGNSPIYMPGFFALAAAAWNWAAGRPIRRLMAEGALTLGFALALAWLWAPAGATLVVGGFARTMRVDVLAAIPASGWPAAIAGLYTATTWTTFVAGARRALERRSWRPLLPLPFMTALLAAGRPWTVNDFTRLWMLNALDGDLTALVSVVAIPVTGWLFHRAPSGTSTHPHPPQTGSHAG